MRVASAEYVRSAHEDADFVRDGRPEVLFAGRSNVGKSSLLNRLLGRKGLARTSSTPGRTRAVNYFLVNGRFYFVDLPGYGYAKAARVERRAWGALVDRYLRRALPGSQVVLLVDGKVGATEL
ncbi:MAG: ribosome biogenesis GTP-binding protein YihA/YsxC, partial [Thermoanaerobaculia bacterium]